MIRESYSRKHLAKAYSTSRARQQEMKLIESAGFRLHVCLSVSLSLSLWLPCLSLYMCVWLGIRVSVCMYVCLFLYLSVWLSQAKCILPILCLDQL